MLHVGVVFIRFDNLDLFLFLPSAVVRIVLCMQLESVGAGAMDASSVSTDGGVSVLGGSGSGMRGADTPDAKKFSIRLKEMYKERINYYRQTIYLLTG